MSKRKTFSKAFKLEAINLLENSDMTAVDVARQLGKNKDSHHLGKPKPLLLKQGLKWLAFNVDYRF